MMNGGWAQDLLRGRGQVTVSQSQEDPPHVRQITSAGFEFVVEAGDTQSARGEKGKTLKKKIIIKIKIN